MSEQSWRSWLRVIVPYSRRTQAVIHTHRRKRRSGRPAIEVLENRLVLSFVLGTTALVEGPSSGRSSDIVAGSGAWTAQPNETWLHTTSSGSGNGLATFAFDANTGPTRTGTLTIAGLTLTVTQAGSGYVAAGPVTIVSSGLSRPAPLGVDSAGNVYTADNTVGSTNSTIVEWNASTQSLTSLVTSGLEYDVDIAVDGPGNVYIADYPLSSIFEFSASPPRTLTTLLNVFNPGGVAVDGAGDVYYSDTSNHINEWNGSKATTLVSTGLNNPYGVAVDSAGNVYIADTGNNAVKEWNATTNEVTTLVSTGLNQPIHVAVDGAGDVFIADRGNGAIKEWNASTKAVTTLVGGLTDLQGIAVDGAGNVYFAETKPNVIEELPRAYVPRSPLYETAAAGSDSLLPVLPTTASLTGVYAPHSDQSWLTISSVSNGVVHFSFTQDSSATARTAHITLLGQQITVTQQPALATGALVEGPATGTDSDIVSVSGAWTATSNDPWLHTQSTGTGNGLATFTFDANTGATRTGTLTIAGETLTVTQAGSGYVAVSPLTTLASGIASTDVAVDGAGNVYIADIDNNAIKEWSATSQKVTTVVSAGLNKPAGVAVDPSGNLYIADTGDKTIKEWNASTGKLTTLVSGLNDPRSVAVASSGNIYIADTGSSTIKEWNVATQTLTTLVASGLSGPQAVAVDFSGNVYIADTGNNAIKEWSATTGNVTTLVSGLDNPHGVATDTSGNVYIADSGNAAIKEWVATSQSVITLVPAEGGVPQGIAVSGAGDVYFADSFAAAVFELTRALVPGAPVSETSVAGSDALLPVFPTSTSLTGLFTPHSDQPWLTVGSASGGVIPFSFTQNTGKAARTAHLTVLGQQITVTQTPPALGTDAVVEGPSAGADSDVVSLPGAWTATANVPWLHTSSSGTGAGLAIFSFDANTGATRTGTLTIAGQTVTVTQAGSSYVAATPLVTLVRSGLKNPGGVAVDSAGNVYIADTLHNAIKEWHAATQTVTTLVAGSLTARRSRVRLRREKRLAKAADASKLSAPSGVAVDAAGNVLIADTGDNAIKEWHAATKTLTTLVTGLNGPSGVAVDVAGNVYIADTGDNAIKEWHAATQTVTTLAAGLNGPNGVAVDSAGNVYIADTGNNAIREWHAATQTVTTLVGSKLSSPSGVAVDGAGNVYIADTGDSVIKEWHAATGKTTALVSSGLAAPSGVALDQSGGVYLSDLGKSAISERPRAFVPGNPIHEKAAKGSDKLLPVLPVTTSLTGVFAARSNQKWLTVGSISNGVVHFSFTRNTGAARTADLTVLGRRIKVTQAAAGERNGMKFIL